MLAVVFPMSMMTWTSDMSHFYLNNGAGSQSMPRYNVWALLILVRTCVIHRTLCHQHGPVEKVV